MRPRNQRGFTLLELLFVVALLMLVTGVVFTQVISVQQRYRQEEQKLDMTQASREAMDEVIRDLHQSGWPSQRMFTASTLGSPAVNSTKVAAGLVAVSSRDIWFEGDVNGDGVVDSVRYQLTADASGNCPCALRRSQQTKIAGAPTSQNVSYTSQLENVVNSGSAGGTLTISGSMTFGTTTRTNDNVYAAYKTAPVFTYYDAAGTAITVPTDLSGSNLATGSAATLLAQVKSVRVTLNVLSPTWDQQTRVRPAITLAAIAKLHN